VKKRVFITPKQAPKALAKFQTLVQAAITDGMRETAQFGLTAVERQIGRTTPYRPVATNTYRQSWTVQKTKHGAILGNPTVQSYFVEVGRKAGKAPPFDAILQWVKVKRLAGKRPKRQKLLKPPKNPRTASGRRKLMINDARRRNNIANAMNQAADEQSIAVAVMMKIKRKGFKGRYVLLKTMPRINKFAVKASKKALADAIKMYQP